MKQNLNILMVAAENDAIARCKVGGIGDVIRDIPVALADQGCTVSVVTPSYGFLHETARAEHAGAVRFQFGGHAEHADLYRLRPRSGTFERAAHYVIDHPAFLQYNSEKEQYDIYSNDPVDRPFASDATKFACFNSAVAAAITAGLFGKPDILHLHDWHAAFLLLLRKYDPDCEILQSMRTVYTIHNLALQGIRPLSGDRSALQSWYPHLRFNGGIPEALTDPRWPDCINPMAVGIRFADAVHAVSPTYADEILEPSRPPQFFGGEGLDSDLKAARQEGRLQGILNGCEYSEPASRDSIADLLKQLKAETARWAAKRTALSFADYTAFQTLNKLAKARKKPAFTAVSISRVVDQKMLLLKAPGKDGTPGLHSLLNTLGPDRLYILLGTGDRDTESFLIETAALYDNFLFLNGFSAKAADSLYASGDLFLMPSSFEPCGIGQMLAMRQGQPCLVHRTGGLRDTVKPGTDGFGFEGETLEKQVEAMNKTLGEALALHDSDPKAWKNICVAAEKARFLWNDSAKQYIDKLYTAKQ